ncbi:MAG TPA: hypothetical protein VEX18_18465 [Polyangiaceae bacterium]|nr:hypothetical protein [Polyangiaceae bacterium]
MNVLSTRVALRERSIAEVFDLAFRFVVVRGGRQYLKLWLVSCVPMLLGCVAMRYAGVGWLWVWSVALAGFVVAQIPFTLAASRLLLGDALPLGGLIKAWLLRVPGQLLMHAVVAAVLAATVWVIFPVPFVLARFLYLPEIVLLEGSGLMRAYERGSRFTRQRFSLALETLVLMTVVLAAFVLGAEITGKSTVEDLLSLPAMADSLFETGGSWFSLFGFFAAVPFLATARFLTYIDVRTRREAWDVQLRFTELAKDPRGGA